LERKKGECHNISKVDKLKIAFWTYKSYSINYNYNTLYSNKEYKIVLKIA
jgi:hypothetical protein